MGIHGEPGAERQILPPGGNSNLTDEMISIVCSRVNDALAAKQELVSTCMSLAVMVNNLGAVSQAEMLIICKAVSDYIFGAQASVLNGNRFPVRMYSGSFMTSLQMTGVSVSCFMIPSDNGHMDQLLREQTCLTAWNPGFDLSPPSERNVLLAPTTRPRSVYRPSPVIGTVDGMSRGGLNSRTENYIIAVTTALLGHVNEFSAIDRKTGDGDFGDTGMAFISFQLHASEDVLPSVIDLLTSVSCCEITIAFVFMSMQMGIVCSQFGEGVTEFGQT